MIDSALNNKNWLITNETIKKRVKILEALGFEEAANGVLTLEGEWGGNAYVYSFDNSNVLDHHIEVWEVTQYDSDYVKDIGLAVFLRKYLNL